jgi:DNA-binding NtrC family response regulator
MMAIGDTIDVEDLPEHIRNPSGRRLASSAAALPSSEEAHRAVTNEMSLEEQEKQLLIDALQRSGGNQSQAARILRISRDRMRYKMAKHNLK